VRESSQRHIEREIASLAGQLIQAGSGWQQVPLMEARSSPHTRSPSQQFAALSEAHLSSAEDILLQVVQRAKDLLGFSGGAILTVRGELAASEGLSEGLVWRLSSGEDPLGVRERLLEQEAPRVYEAGREAWLSALWECGFALVAAVPLRLSIGEASLLLLGSARLPAGYAREEALLEHLGLLQSQVVVALEHRALHWRTRRNARRLEAVGRALQRLNRVERPGDTIQTTCDQVRYIFDGSAVWVGLYERGEGGELVGLRPAVCVSGQEALLEALETRADTMAGGLYEESLRLGGIMQRATSVAWLVRPEVLAQACEQSHHPLRRLLVQETMGGDAVGADLERRGARGCVGAAPGERERVGARGLYSFAYFCGSNWFIFMDDGVVG
jgi:hypothetical protein